MGEGGRKGQALTSCPLTSAHTHVQASKQCDVIRKEGDLLGGIPFHSRQNDNYSFSISLSLFVFLPLQTTLEYLTSSARRLGSEWLAHS